MPLSSASTPKQMRPPVSHRGLRPSRSRSSLSQQRFKKKNSGSDDNRATSLLRPQTRGQSSSSIHGYLSRSRRRGGGRGRNSRSSSPANSHSSGVSPRRHASPSRESVRSQAPRRHVSPSRESVRSQAPRRHASPSRESVRSQASAHGRHAAPTKPRLSIVADSSLPSKPIVTTPALDLESAQFISNGVMLNLLVQSLRKLTDVEVRCQ